jgi:hypothetical protein
VGNRTTREEADVRKVIRNTVITGVLIAAYFVMNDSQALANYGCNQAFQECYYSGGYFNQVHWYDMYTLLYECCYDGVGCFQGVCTVY